MTLRMRHWKLAHDAFAALLEADKAAPGGLDRKLVEMVRLRASQINGCAFCVELHARELRGAGETDARVALVAAWRDASSFTEKERAALAWTEAVTLVAESHTEDEVFALVKAQFNEEEIARLTYVIAIINAWNRVYASSRTPERVPAPADVKTS